MAVKTQPSFHLTNSTINRHSWLEDEDLKNEEKEFLHLTSNGELDKLRSLFEKYGKRISVDCCDCKGYRALDIAVTLHDEELVRGLLSVCNFSDAHIKGALMRSVEVSDVRLIEILTEKCQDNDPKSLCYSIQQNENLTPIILAAINEDFEMIMFLLNKGYCIPKPHLPKCGCANCSSANSSETLKKSIALINACRALSSPIYIVISSPDPILTAFKLSSKNKILANEIPEHREVYQQLSVQCSQFSADFLQQCRSTEEVEILLAQKNGLKDSRNHRHSRLWLAAYYQQKRFVAHPHCQQVLYSTWLEGFTAWKTFSNGRKILHVVTQCLLAPILCVIYMLLPRANFIKSLKVPFNRFIHCVSSYIIFLVLLLLSMFSDNHQDIREMIVWPRLAADVWIAGNVMEGLIKIPSVGFKRYAKRWWGKYNLAMYVCFTASESISIGMQLYSYYKSDDITWNRMELPWWHPVLIGEGLFACACVLAFCRILKWYQMEPTLGPLGTSLTEMVNDVMRFFTIFFVLMFSFAAGINYIYRKYEGAVRIDKDGNITTQRDDFISLRNTFKALFWATFGLGDPDYATIVVSGNFTNGPVNHHRFTEDVGYLMWGFYHLLTVIIMLNMLIAMMTQSYERIQGNADTEWKFARGTLWLSYFDGDSVPSPYNLIPSVRRIITLAEWTFKKLTKKPEDSESPSSLEGVYFKKSCCSFDEVDHARSRDYEDRYQKLLTQLRRRYLEWRKKGQIGELYQSPPNLYERRERIKQATSIIRRS